MISASFNIKNMPIVENPDDALDCFSKSFIDYLVIGDFICEKI